MTTQTETSIPAKGTEDLQRLVEVAQLVTAARDAMSDEIVTRLSWAMSEGLTLLDRLTRNEGLMHLLKVLDRQDTQYLLIALSDAIHEASQKIPAYTPATNGLGSQMRVVRIPRTQERKRLLAVTGMHLSHSL